MNKQKEREMLDIYANKYVTANESSQERLLRNFEMRIFQAYMSNGVALELGCEVGYMSEMISKLVARLDIIDASKEFITQTKSRNLKNVNYYCMLFEDLTVCDTYDYVFASHVLEHLYDVQTVLNIIKKALKSSGYLFVAVPNARALSRQLARHMGLIDDLYNLTPNDIKGGHRRVYDQVTLAKEIEKAGFKIIAKGGIMFKPFADFQMDKLIEVGILGEPQSEALFSLGFEYPDMCADAYIVAKINT